MRTADLLQNKAEEMFSRFGLSATQYNALRILRGAGPHGLSCNEVGKRMINHDPDITRLLDRLERRDFISRGRDAKDRRVIKVCITESGLRLLKRMDRDVNHFHKSVLGHAGQSNLTTLIELLELARKKS